MKGKVLKVSHNIAKIKSKFDMRIKVYGLIPISHLKLYLIVPTITQIIITILAFYGSNFIRWNYPECEIKRRLLSLMKLI